MTYYRISLANHAPDERFRSAALWVFLAVALTDALDGFLARSRGEVTRLGRILDPLADKLLLLAAIVMLTAPSLPALHPQLPVWFSWVVISRDALLAVGVYVVHHLTGHVEVRPNWLGKVSTVLQMACVVGTLGSAPAAWLNVLAGMAAAGTVGSLAAYVRSGWRQLTTPPRIPSTSRAGTAHG
jgi:CDP-diacylglycerol--glycerol-3-phosphate 3-phosphatidyltransferase